MTSRWRFVECMHRAKECPGCVAEAAEARTRQIQQFTSASTDALKSSMARSDREDRQMQLRMYCLNHHHEFRSLKTVDQCSACACDWMDDFQSREGGREAYLFNGSYKVSVFVSNFGQCKIRRQLDCGQADISSVLWTNRHEFRSDAGGISYIGLNSSIVRNK